MFIGTTLSKYKNKKTVVDNITFDSAGEARRYQELKLLARGGAIENLELQPTYELQPSFKRGKSTIRAIKYIADFRYIENGHTIVEDYKGMELAVWKLKEKMFLFRYPELELRVVKP